MRRVSQTSRSLRPRNLSSASGLTLRRERRLTRFDSKRNGVNFAFSTLKILNLYSKYSRRLSLKLMLEELQESLLFLRFLRIMY